MAESSYVMEERIYAIKDDSIVMQDMSFAVKERFLVMKMRIYVLKSIFKTMEPTVTVMVYISFVTAGVYKACFFSSRTVKNDI